MLRPALLLVFVSLLAGCGDAGGGNPAFTASGEVIALSGGDGGPTHACASCHGLKGEGDGRLVPRLAGLDAGYLHRQLDDYANGRREHAEMRAIVRRLSMDDRAKVSAYYSALPAPAASPPRVSRLYLAKCAVCHGAAGEGVGPANPPLAGQSAAYVEAQLLAWRAGKRRGDGMNEMLEVSRALALAEVRALANLHQEGLAEGPPVSLRRLPAPAASR
jgi:cytochrome c553